MIEQIIALSIFIIALILIITEKIHRSITIIVAVTALLSIGLLNIEEAVHYIDFETLLLLGGMMVIVEILRELGFFHYIAIKIAKKSKNYRTFFMLMCLATGLLSPFLDSVTVVLIFSSITVAVLKILKRNPKPLLLSQVFCSNIGGNATLIGEPTNIMVATHKGFTFIDFIYALTPITIVSLAICVYLLSRNIEDEKEDIMSLVMELDEYSFIKDKVQLQRAVTIFIFTIILFFLHNILHISPATVALIGASIMLLTVRTDITKILSKLEWSTLIFIGGFFVVVGGLTKAGIIDYIAKNILDLRLSGILLILLIGLLTAFGSAIMDNIPFVALMIPVIDKLSLGFESNILWWIMLAGANMGGNLTPIAASPNIVVIAVSEREGTPITFREFIKIGIPISIITLFIAILILTVQYLIGLI